MINPLKALLFLTGGTVAAGTGAYVSGALDPFFNPQPPAAIATLPADTADPTVAVKPAEEAAPKEDRVDQAAAPAEQPAASGEQPTTTTAEQPATEPKPAETEVAAVDPAAPVALDPTPEPTAPVTADPAPQPAIPAAGPVAPTFDLVRVEADGSMVIAGKAAANAKIELLTGETVIGAGTAGAEGDFAIVLDKPLAPGDYQLTIRATNPDNSVVMSAQTAIVSIPKDAGGPVLAMIEEPGKPSEIITVPQPEVAAADAEPAEPKPDDQVAAADASKPTADASSSEPAKPAEDSAASEPTPTGTDVAAADGKPVSEETTAQPPAIGTDVASADPKPEEPATTTQPVAATIDVAVEAVEIEGTKIFVAGRAPAGSTIRVYADEFLLGETKASEAGRFLVEADRELAVGNYVVRADVIGADGVEVIARAAVPFEREPGENVAAVAAAQPAASESKPAEVAVAEPPASDQPVAAPDETTPPATAADQPATTGDQTEQQAAAAAGQPAADEPAEAPATTATDEAPATGDQAGQPATTADGATTTQPATGADGTTTTQPAAVEVPATTTEPKPAEVATAEQPATSTEVTAPALQAVNSAVIIRRGDSLWRISKRVYGRGVRYSTIYLANQDQIRDPDRIWPGQVFSVPDKTQEGENADLTTMGEQATSKQ